MFFGLILLSACEAPVNQALDLTPQTAALHLSGEMTHSGTEAIAHLKKIPPLSQGKLSAALSQQYRWLAKELEHGAWSLEDKVTRNEIYCHELCQCISDRVISWRDSKSIPLAPEITLYQMTITSPSGYIHAKAGNLEKVFFYHKTTLFKSPSGQISVYDPILMPDARLHPLSTLLERLENPASLRYSVVRR